MNGGGGKGRGPWIEVQVKKEERKRKKGESGKAGGKGRKEAGEKGKGREGEGGRGGAGGGGGEGDRRRKQASGTLSETLQAIVLVWSWRRYLGPSLAKGSSRINTSG